MVKLPDANLQVYKKNYFTHPPSCSLLSFSQNVSRLLLPKTLWKCANTLPLRKHKRKVVLLVIYLFNYDSSKPAFFRHLILSWIQFLSNNQIEILRFLQYKALQEYSFFFLSLYVLICTFKKYFFWKNVIVLHHGDILF